MLELPPKVNNKPDIYIWYKMLDNVSISLIYISIYLLSLYIQAITAYYVKRFLKSWYPSCNPEIFNPLPSNNSNNNSPPLSTIPTLNIWRCYLMFAMEWCCFLLPRNCSRELHLGRKICLPFGWKRRAIPFNSWLARMQRVSNHIHMYRCMICSLSLLQPTGIINIIISIMPILFIVWVQFNVI